MPKDNSLLPDHNRVSASATAESRTERRKQLAQLIGRLLAKTWLERRPDRELESTSGHGSAEEGRAT